MQPAGFQNTGLGDRDVAVFKRNSTKIERKLTTLYFVGVEMMQQLGGTTRPVFVKGQPFNLPALGESIVVDEVIARDLIDKTRWSPPGRDKDAKAMDVLIRAENGGQQMAAMLKEAIANGTPLSELNLYGVQKRSITSNLSDDELIAALQARGIDTATLTNNTPVKADSEDASKDAPKDASKDAPVVNKAVPTKK